MGNAGLAAATGDYIQFLDADDLLEPSKLEHQARLIADAPRPPGLVAASYTKLHVETGDRSVPGVDEDAWAGLLTARLGITSANLWHAASVRLVGGWHEGLVTSEDPDLAFRLLQSGASVLVDPVPLTLLRRRADSQWNQDMRRSLEGWVDLRSRMWSHLRESGLDTSARKETVERSAHRTLRSLVSQAGHTPRSAAALLDRRGLPHAPHAEGTRYQTLHRWLGFAAAEWVRSRGSEVRSALARLRR